MTSFKDKFKELAVKVFVPNEGEECEMIYLEDALDVANLMDVNNEGVNAEWTSFRREVAKDILANTLSCPATMNLGDKAIKTVGDYVSFAIELADELIKQLKEHEE